jgi:hypothetical protein
MPELVTCPSCGCKVQAAETVLGRRTRCIACGHVFRAGEPGDPPPAEPISYPLVPPEREEPPAPPPSLEHGPARYRMPLCPRCCRPVSWQEPLCPHCGHLFDPEVPDAQPPWARRRDGEPHRGPLIVNLGTISLMGGTFGVCLPGVGALVALAAGIPALVMAGHDLQLMREGVMDPEGLGLTERGRNYAVVGVVLAVLFAVFCVLFVVDKAR